MSFQLKSNIGQVSSEIQRRAGKAVERTALFAESHIKLGMAEEKHGREYGNHVASAPGESPAMDTGFLANSVGHEMTGETSAIVGAGAEYAVHLEFGTVHIAPRPYFAPAFEAAKLVFEKELKEALK